MKKIVFTIGLGLVCGGLMTAVQAQDNKTPTPRPATPTVVTPMAITPGTPGAPAVRPPIMDQTESLARRVNLTEEQKTKVRAIFEEQTKQMQAIREKTMAGLKEVLTPEQWEKSYGRMSSFGPRTNAPAIRPLPTAPPRSAPVAPAK